MNSKRGIVIAVCMILIIWFDGNFEFKLDRAKIKEHEKIIIESDYNNLVMLVLAEAADQPHDGQVAVAATVLNRLEISLGGTTITEIIFCPGQFSCCYNGYFCHADGIPLTFDSYSHQKINEARKAVDEALNGADPTAKYLGGGALYYYNPDCTSDYELAKRANLKNTCRIGDHVFFKDWT